MDLRHLRVSREQDAPIYLQLYRRYREAIATGKLLPGDRVPSVRSLASELNLARGTVETAYQILTSEGYLVARGVAGTVVSPRLANLPEPGTARTAGRSVHESPPLAGGFQRGAAVPAGPARVGCVSTQGLGAPGGTQSSHFGDGGHDLPRPRGIRAAAPRDCGLSGHLARHHLLA